MTERDRLWLAILLAAFVLTGTSVLPVPFMRDQGVYAYTAWRWQDGAVPYLRAFDHKGPLLYALYALGLTVSGGAMWGPNLLDLIARAAGIWLTWTLAKRLLRGHGPLFAAALTALPLFGWFNTPWREAQAETFMLPLLVASAWLALLGAGERGARWSGAARLAVAGLLAAQAVMLKPTSGLHALFLMSWLWLASPAPARDRWRAPALFAAGAIAGVLPWLLYFAAAGALGAMWEVLVVFNQFHLQEGSGGLQSALHGAVPIFQIIPLLALLPLVLRARAAPGGDGLIGQRGGAAFVYGWLAVSVLQIAVQGKYFFYHWVTLAPALALPAGAGLQAILERGAAAGKRRLALAAVGIALLWLIGANGVSWYRTHANLRTLDYALGRISRDAYWSSMQREDFNLAADAAAANIARERIPEGGRLLVFGFEPLVNWLARRPAPTRFAFDYPLSFPPRSARAERTRAKWRAEFLADLRARPPEMVMLVDNDANPLEPLTSAQQASQWPELRAFLAANYDQVGRIEDFLVLGRAAGR